MTTKEPLGMEVDGEEQTALDNVGTIETLTRTMRQCYERMDRVTAREAYEMLEETIVSLRRKITDAGRSLV